MSIHLHLSQRINELGRAIHLPTNTQWIEAIKYVQLFMAFEKEIIGQRILISTEIHTLATRETVYTDYIITRIQGGWSRHVAVFFTSEPHPYLYHVSMYVEVEKRTGIWNGMA